MPPHDHISIQKPILLGNDIQLSSESAYPSDEVQAKPRKRDFKVYITGFGPFGNRDENPSYLIASTLRGTLPDFYVKEPVALKTHVSILAHPEFVKVAYSTVDELIPKIHKIEGIDLFIHIGLAPIEGYRIESRARRGPYNWPGVDGRRLLGSIANGAAHGKVPDGIEQVKVGLDFDNLLTFLTSSKEVDDNDTFTVPKISNDAGLFLCEYILYNSAMEAVYIDADPEKTTQHISERSTSDGTIPSTSRVMFIHIPPEVDKESLEHGRETVKRIIGAVVSQLLDRTNIE